MTTPVKPSTEIDQYQEQLINAIHEVLIEKQQQIITQNLTRSEFTEFLKRTLTCSQAITPKLLD